MFFGETYNEYGTKVNQYVCEFCGTLFTVCPPPKRDADDYWKGCLDKSCESYDSRRDADKYFI